MSSDKLDYIAACPECNGLLCWQSSKVPDKDSAKEVSKWIRDGLDVQRCTTAEAKARKWDHAATCTKAKKKGATK